MRRWLTLASLALLTGCSLMLKPNYDAIVPDLDASHGPDASDAGDAGIDGGTDAGFDGGMQCVPVNMQETDCEHGLDEDCDGQIDCFDYDCRGAPVCCRSGAAALRSCLSSLADWNRFPTATTELELTGSCDTAEITAFGTSRKTRALISAECQPINFGMRFELDFTLHVTCPGTDCDRAAFSLTPVPTLLDGAPLESELSVIVSADGSARVARSGTTLGELDAGTFVVDAANPVHLRMDLEPGVLEGGDVLYATVQLRQSGAPADPILARTAVMPLVDLRCVGGDAGLYAAIEGAGSDVGVRGPLQYTQYECSNPSQFQPDQGVVLTTPTTCATGGVGAPALVNYCSDNCDSAGSEQLRWDLWVDSSEIDRGQEKYRFVEFGICGYAHEDPELPNGTNGDFITRPAPSGSFLWPLPPSVREPTLLPLADYASPRRVENLWYAFAERMETAEVYRIRGGSVPESPGDGPNTVHDLLAPAQTGECVSLRDPLLVADWAERDGAFAVSGAWLFFTCVHAGEPLFSIGAVHVGTDFTADLETLRTDVLTATMGGYALRGVSAPEGFSEVPHGALAQLTIRLWFSAHDGAGQVRLAYAQGRGALEDLAGALPELEPYPANPILDGASAILGGDCSRDCSLEDVSVTRSENDLGNYYQFLVARSRQTDTSTVYELVPLLQPAPND